MPIRKTKNVVSTMEEFYKTYLPTRYAIQRRVNDFFLNTTFDEVDFQDCSLNDSIELPRKTSRKKRTKGHDSRDARIQELYTNLGILISMPPESGTAERIKMTMDELRDLQTQQASEIHSLFLKKLSMPINEGSNALAKADALLEKYANSVTK